MIDKLHLISGSLAKNDWLLDGAAVVTMDYASSIAAQIRSNKMWKLFGFAYTTHHMSGGLVNENAIKWPSFASFMATINQANQLKVASSMYFISAHLVSEWLLIVCCLL